MCGIVGVFQYKSEIDRKTRAQALRILFSETMLKTEPRGPDATGLYQVQANGDWMLAKKGEKVSEWLVAEPGNEDPHVYQDFTETWDQHPFEMVALIGHCRKATVGSRGKDNNDNHPFIVQIDEKNAILGIHNGTLYNHEIIFKNLKEISDSHLVRQGSVDSESIFHMMYHVTEHGTKPIDGDMLQYMGKRLDGAYACIVVNSRFPKQIVTFRNGRPTEFAMITPLNIVLVASDKKFIESAIEKYNFIRQWVDIQLPDLKITYRNLIEKDYRIFDLTKTFPKNPTWNSLEDISERGNMLKHNTFIEDMWKGTIPVQTNTYPNTKSPPNTVFKPAISKVTTASRSKFIPMTPGITATQKKSEDVDDLVTVDAKVTRLKVGSKEDVQLGYERAKLLGLCPNLDTPKEITNIIGLPEHEMRKLTTTELANKVGQAFFNYGYAMGRVDSKQEVDDIRKKGRDQLRLIEKTMEKKRKAEGHIWELKQLLLIYQALSKGGFPITSKNLSIVLKNYIKCGDSRKTDILNTNQEINKDQSAEKQINNLVANFKRVKKITTMTE